MFHEITQCTFYNPFSYWNYIPEENNNFYGSSTSGMLS